MLGVARSIEHVTRNLMRNNLTAATQSRVTQHDRVHRTSHQSAPALCLA
jgi:hypothetical protein